MAKDKLEGIKEHYDAIVIGSGLAGLTSANVLSKAGHKVLLLEHHYQFGGLSTWFKRRGGHIFDVSLHGFPVGMIKSCRKYWGKNISDRIHQIKQVRFVNPQFNLDTTFTREDFSRILVEHFKIKLEVVEEFFTTLRKMNYYEDNGETTGELFERYFPGRNDVTRFLLEPIAYANGSTLQDPAITFGIVFSNFMSKGVYIFNGGTDLMISEMVNELKNNGADLRKQVKVEKILIENGQTCGVIANGREIKSKVVVSNASIQGTILGLSEHKHFDKDFIEETQSIRRNHSSTQVYIGLKPEASIPFIGDLIFTSTLDHFSSEALVAKETTSRTFSLYYPEMRPGKNRTAIVSSTNAWKENWEGMTEEEYQKAKEELIEETLDSLEKFIPDIREMTDHLEAATPRTFEYYTLHPGGASFGTKFEGLKVSEKLPDQVAGLYHAGSVGIIMSGWLGAINYGVIVSNKVDRYLQTNS